MDFRTALRARNLKRGVALGAATLLLAGGVAACSDTSSDSASGSASQTTAAATSSGTSAAASGTSARGSGQGGGPGIAVSASSVSTEEQLVALIQEAYGDGGLGLQRGHQPVESTLIEVLGITHDEMHVRMDAGQNLAAVATDLGIDPQTLIDALVDSWSPAIDSLVESGAITQSEADAYHDALEDAFTFRVTWNGSDATPVFSGLSTA